MRLAAHRIAVDLPAGWEGRLWKRTDGLPVVQAANFALPAADGDFGTSAVERMPAGGVLVVLIEYDQTLAGTPLFAAARPARLRAAELRPTTLLRSLPGQAGAQRFFTDGGRAFCLYVVIGSNARARELAAAASSILSGLSIG